ncbi:hypothetical protein QE152_g786 [Popillia japonica]|uniref:Uncharacterized protein n=1 Tax=Popillia japonica TaxID=7064 RepID=A0AAW1NAZ4_POPJA
MNKQNNKNISKSQDLHNQVRYAEAVKSTGAIKKVTFADPIPMIDSKIEGALDEESYTVVQRNKRLSKVLSKETNVYRKLDKDTSVNDIQGYLKSKNFKDIICEKLASKHPDEYASFKISVPITILEEIKSPNLWPVGTCIDRFLLNLGQKKRPQ